MYISKAKVYLAAAHDDSRPILTSVHYNAEKQRLEATDGFTLAVCPVEAEFDEELPTENKHIPVAALKEAQKGIGKGSKPTISLNGSTVKTKGISFDAPNPGCNYPNVDQIIPGEEELSFVTAIDAKKLYDLARAICDNGTSSSPLYVRIYAQYGNAKKSAMVVKPMLENCNNMGLIMPMYSRMDEDAYK